LQASRFLLDHGHELRRGHGLDTQDKSARKVAQVMRHDGAATTVHSGFQHHVVIGVRQLRSPKKVQFLRHAVGTQEVHDIINGLFTQRPHGGRNNTASYAITRGTVTTCSKAPVPTAVKTA
jgi:Flp pilus assembly CpaF family ATPase